MAEINAQLLQQRRFTLITLGREGGEPAGAQTRGLAHPTGHGRAARYACAAKAGE